MIDLISLNGVDVSNVNRIDGNCGEGVINYDNIVHYQRLNSAFACQEDEIEWDDILSKNMWVYLYYFIYLDHLKLL